MKVRTQGLVVKMVVILVEEEKMRGMLVVVVGVVDRSPSPTLPKGRESILAVFYAVGFDSFPLGKVGIVDRSPSPALPKGRESILAVFEEVGWNSLPLGRVGEGLLCRCLWAYHYGFLSAHLYMGMK